MLLSHLLLKSTHIAIAVSNNKVFTSGCPQMHLCYLRMLNSWPVWWHDYKSGPAPPWWSLGQRRGGELQWNARTGPGYTWGWPVRAGCMGRTEGIIERETTEEKWNCIRKRRLFEDIISNMLPLESMHLSFLNCMRNVSVLSLYYWSRC